MIIMVDGDNNDNGLWWRADRNKNQNKVTSSSCMNKVELSSRGP